MTFIQGHSRSFWKGQGHSEHMYLVYEKKCHFSLLKQRNSIRKVSELLGIPPTTISSVKKSIEQRGSEENIKRSGRPRTLIDRN